LAAWLASDDSGRSSHTTGSRRTTPSEARSHLGTTSEEDEQRVRSNEDDEAWRSRSLLTVPLSREDVYEWLEDDALRPDEKLARRIAYVLTVGPVACPADKHARWSTLHDARCAHHLPLSHTWAARPTGYTVASMSESPAWANQLGLRCPVRPLGDAALRLSRSDLPAAQRLEARFSGWPDEGYQAGAEICLHEEDRPPLTMAAAVHDVDSFLHVTHDPTDLTGPLRVCLSPQPASLLTKSVHVRVPVDVDGATVPVPLYHIPHLVFAKQGSNVVYMFFPRLYRPTKKKTKAAAHLTNEQHQLFFHGLVRPSFAQIGPAFAQHVPDSFLSVQASSRAAVEATGAPMTRGRSVEVPYNAANLQHLWRTMRATLDAADEEEHECGGGSNDAHPRTLRQFGDPIFVYDCKDTKLWYQSAQQPAVSTPAPSTTTTPSTASAALDAFWNVAGAAVAPYTRDAVHAMPAVRGGWPQEGRTQLIDIAAEFLPAESGYTSLARRCCQYNTLLFLAGQTREALFGDGDGDDGPTARRVDSQGPEEASENEDEEEAEEDEDEEAEASAAADTNRGERWTPPHIPRTVTTEYPIHLLRDAVTVTCEPRKTSPLFGRVPYIQSYTPEKGSFRAAGVLPFSHPNLYNLGHSDQVWSSLARAGGIKAERHSAETALSAKAFALCQKVA
jgi:hypothetical protein